MQSTLKSGRNILDGIRNKIEAIKKEKLELYERYCSGELTKEEYLDEKAVLNKELERKEEEEKLAEKEVRDLPIKETSVASEAEAICRIYRDEDKLTYEMAHAFVDRIIVFQDHRIEIVWRFKDIFSEYAENVPENN